MSDAETSDRKQSKKHADGMGNKTKTKVQWWTKAQDYTQYKREKDLKSRKGGKEAN